MKKLILIFVLCLSLLLFPACAKKEPIYDVEYNGRTYTVDTVAHTIDDGDYTYTYEKKDGGDHFILTFPDGSTYWWQRNSMGWYGGGSSDYTDGKYSGSWVLMEILEQEAPKQRSDGKILPFFLLLIVGLFNLLAPQVSWHLGYGWRYKNAEPSDAALIMARISGGIAIAAAVLWLFV